MAATYTLISSQVLGTTASSVTFSSIPQTYTDLKLTCSARDNGSNSVGALYIGYNGDTSSGHFSFTQLNNTGSVQTASYTSQNYNINYFTEPSGSSTANTFGSVDLYIPSYTLTGTKQVYSFGVGENNTTAANNYGVVIQANLYQGTSAITSLNLFPGSGSFVAYSSFYLYGIRNS